MEPRPTRRGPPRSARPNDRTTPRPSRSGVVRGKAGVAPRQEQADVALPATVSEGGQADLLAGVARQFLTPVTSIKAASEVLLDDSVREALDPSHKDILLRSLVRGVGVLEGLVQQLLQYGQLRSGSARLAPEVVDIGEVVQDCVGLIQPALLSRGQSVKVDFAQPLPLLALDPERMKQALLNLLSNASKFSPAGSEVYLSVAARDGRMLFAVRDACGGMTAEEMEDLFQPCSPRTRLVGGRGVGGTGLGLALAKGWVELHGGVITVENQPGQGCTFTVSVPGKGNQVAGSSRRRRGGASPRAGR